MNFVVLSLRIVSSSFASKNVKDDKQSIMRFMNVWHSFGNFLKKG